MGKLLKVLLVIGILGGATFGAVLYTTSGLTETADGFFRALKSQDAAKARAFLAQATSQKLDDRTLQKLMANDAIVAFKELSFPNRRVSGSRGELSGTLTTTSGGVVPVQMVLVEEAGVWKVFAFQTAR